MANISALMAALAALPAPTNTPSFSPYDNGNGGPQLAAPGQPPINVMPPAAPPDVPPTAPAPPLDQNLIAQIIAAGQLPAPTPPQPPGRLQQIASALAGFGAGVQGQGTEFLQRLTEPQRIYQAQLQNYNQNQANLRLGALQAARQEQNQQQAETQRQANTQQQQDFEVAMRKAGITDQMALLQAQNALRLQEEADKRKEAEAKALEVRKQKFSEDLGKQIRFYKANGVGDSAQARRLALNDMAEEAGQLGYTVPTLTTADNKQLGLVSAKINKVNAEANKANRVTVNLGATGPAFAQLENGQVVPISAIDKRTGTATINGQTLNVSGFVGGKIPAQPQTAPAPQQSALPSSALGMFAPNAAPAFQQQAAPTFKRAEVIQFARQQKRKVADVIADIKARGGTVQ